MLRLIARTFGPPAEVLEIEHGPWPALGPGDALVRMRASPINPSDLIPVTGAYRQRTDLPFIPGYEGVGTIVDVGLGTDRTRIGRRVLPLGTAGCWQQFKVHPVQDCIDVPDDIDDASAATAYINPLTAILMLHELAPEPGQRIAVSAGRSAIGRIMLRMLASWGVTPVAIVRTCPPSNDPLRKLGEIITEDAPIPPIDGGLDAVGGSLGAAMAAAIRPGGKLLHYGLLSGISLTDGAQADLRLFRLRDHVRAMSTRERHEALTRCFGLIRTGAALTQVEASYPLRDFRRALQHEARQGRFGKVLLRMSTNSERT